MSIADVRTGGLLRVLGVTFGIAVAVGAMIGVGILRAPSLVAQLVPDTGLMLALWAAGALMTALEANAVAELVSSMPQAGGPYVYVRHAFGDVGGLAVGWTTWMAFICAIAALSVSFADFLGLMWPAAEHAKPFTTIAIQLVLYGFNAKGVQQGSLLQQVTSFAKLLVLGAFGIIAVFVGSRLHHPAPHATAPIGWIGMIAAYQLIAGAYSGWSKPAYFAEENRNPGSAIPRALAGAILLTSALYFTVNAALLYALGATGVGREVLPFSTIFAQVGGSLAAVFFALCAMLFTISSANANIMAAPRILFALSRDGMLPRLFQAVNKGGSPAAGYMLTAAASIALAATGSFRLVFGLIATLNAATMALVILALFVLRRREPNLARPYLAFGYPWLPGVALAVEIALFLLFMRGNPLGAVYAVGFWLLCIPFAFFARRAAAGAAP